MPHAGLVDQPISSGCNVSASGRQRSRSFLRRPGIRRRAREGIGRTRIGPRRRNAAQGGRCHQSPHPPSHLWCRERRQGPRILPESRRTPWARALGKHPPKRGECRMGIGRSADQLGRQRQRQRSPAVAQLVRRPGVRRRAREGIERIRIGPVVATLPKGASVARASTPAWSSLVPRASPGSKNFA